MGKLKGRTVRRIRKVVKGSQIVITAEGSSRTGRRVVLGREILDLDASGSQNGKEVTRDAINKLYKHTK